MLVTYRGKEFDYKNIKNESIDIDDIIHSLTNINRFNGHSVRAYSVGEHTIMCLLMAEKLGLNARERLLVFIHDFTEAYVGDCPAPLKALLPEFKKIEENVEMAILKHLDIEPPTEKEYEIVKRIDLTMLLIEMKHLTLHNYEKFINEHTLTEFLEDDKFQLCLEDFDKEILVKSLHQSFNKLMEEVRNEKI